MSKILYLDEARQHTLSAGSEHLMRLVPGRNVVDDGVFNAVLNDVGKDANGKRGISRLQNMIDDGTIKVAGETVDISKMKVSEALNLVELETTEVGLNDLIDQENASVKPRKTVVEALAAKLESILKPKETNPEE